MKYLLTLILAFGLLASGCEGEEGDEANDLPPNTVAWELHAEHFGTDSEFDFEGTITDVDSAPIGDVPEDSYYFMSCQLVYDGPYTWLIIQAQDIYYIDGFSMSLVVGGDSGTFDGAGEYSDVSVSMLLQEFDTWSIEDNDTCSSVVYDDGYTGEFTCEGSSYVDYVLGDLPFEFSGEWNCSEIRHENH